MKIHEEKNRNFEELLTESFRPVDHNEKLDFINSKIIAEAREKDMSEVYEMKKVTSKRFRRAVAVIAVCLIIPAGAFGIGKIVSYVSSSEDTVVYNETSEIDKSISDAGMDFAAPSIFNNGYAFKKAELETVKKMDGDNNEVGKFNTWNGIYEKKGHKDLNLSVNKIQKEDKDESIAEKTSSFKDKNGNAVKVSFVVCHYKWVPAGYKKTSEDKANEANPNYHISYGSDKVEETDEAYVEWQQGGLVYILSGFTKDANVEDAFNMAKAIIAKNK